MKDSTIPVITWVSLGKLRILPLGDTSVNFVVIRVTSTSFVITGGALGGIGVLDSMSSRWISLSDT